MLKRLAFFGLLGASAVSAHAVVLFADGFESGDFSNWDGTTGTGTVPAAIDSTVFHTGAFSARVTGSTTAGEAGVSRFANFDRAELPGETIRTTFWMKLAAASSNHRHFNEIRSYAGNTFNSGALEQIYAIGTWNAATVNAVNTNKWQARIAFNRAGGPGVAGWYTLDQAANRTTDWTKFTIEVTPTTVQFFVNDVAGLASPLDRGNTGSLDSFVMGSRLSSVNINANMDDIEVTAVPEPATLAALGAGIAALLRRRARKA